MPNDRPGEQNDALENPIHTAHSIPPKIVYRIINVSGR
jgi:hypothetical protein